MVEAHSYLYFDRRKTGLTPELINMMMSRNDYDKFCATALHHFDSIKPRLEECKDFRWMKLNIELPFFADFIFRFGSTLFGVLFAEKAGDKYETLLGLSFSIKKCKEFSIVPVILPFSSPKRIDESGEGIWKLYDAEKYAEEGVLIPVDPFCAGGDERRPIGKWEETSLFCDTCVKELQYNIKNLCDEADMLIQTFPGVDPSICWTDEYGLFNWMVIRGRTDENTDVPEPVGFFKRMQSEIGGIGHFGVVTLMASDDSGIILRGGKTYGKAEIYELKFK